jgi:hypothetical protein
MSVILTSGHRPLRNARDYDIAPGVFISNHAAHAGRGSRLLR